MLGVSKLGSECRHCVGSHKWFCVSAEGPGKKMVSANSFVSGVVSYSIPPGHALRLVSNSPSHIPWAFFKLIVLQGIFLSSFLFSLSVGTQLPIEYLSPSISGLEPSPLIFKF